MVNRNFDRFTLTWRAERVLSSVFDTEMEASDNMARLEENRKRVDRTASLVASETLFRQNTLAQERHRVRLPLRVSFTLSRSTLQLFWMFQAPTMSYSRLRTNSLCF